MLMPRPLVGRGVLTRNEDRKMTEKTVDWVKFDASKWIAGTMTLPADVEYVFFRLCLLGYDLGNHEIDVDLDDAVGFCKVDQAAFDKAVALLARRGKVAPSGDGKKIVVRSVEARLVDARERISKNHERTEKARQARDGKPRKRVLKPKEKTPPNVTVGIREDNNTEQHKTEDKITGDIQSAFDAYNAMASQNGLTVAQVLNDTRQSKIAQHLAECGGLDGWTVALEKVAASTFLCGQNANGWKADLDFLLQKKSFTKLLEGSYDRTAGAGGGQSQGANRMAQGFENVKKGRDNGE